MTSPGLDPSPEYFLYLRPEQGYYWRRAYVEFGAEAVRSVYGVRFVMESALRAMRTLLACGNETMWATSFLIGGIDVILAAENERYLEADLKLAVFGRRARL